MGLAYHSAFLLFLLYASSRLFFFFMKNKSPEYMRLASFPALCYLFPLLMGEYYWFSYIFLVGLLVIAARNNTKKLLGSQSANKEVIKRKLQWVLLEMAAVFFISFILVKGIWGKGYFTPDF